MPIFKITYTDPEDENHTITVTEEFHDTESVTALGWAEDYAYAVADKGFYEIEELNRQYNAMLKCAVPRTDAINYGDKENENV